MSYETRSRRQDRVVVVVVANGGNRHNVCGNAGGNVCGNMPQASKLCCDRCLRLPQTRGTHGPNVLIMNRRPWYDVNPVTTPRLAPARRRRLHARLRTPLAVCVCVCCWLSSTSAMRPGSVLLQRGILLLRTAIANWCRPLFDTRRSLLLRSAAPAAVALLWGLVVTALHAGGAFTALQASPPAALVATLVVALAAAARLGWAAAVGCRAARAWSNLVSEAVALARVVMFASQSRHYPAFAATADRHNTIDIILALGVAARHFVRHRTGIHHADLAFIVARVASLKDMFLCFDGCYATQLDPPDRTTRHHRGTGNDAHIDVVEHAKPQPPQQNISQKHDIQILHHTDFTPSRHSPEYPSANNGNSRQDVATALTAAMSARSDASSTATTSRRDANLVDGATSDSGMDIPISKPDSKVNNVGATTTANAATAAEMATSTAARAANSGKANMAYWEKSDESITGAFRKPLYSSQLNRVSIEYSCFLPQMAEFASEIRPNTNVPHVIVTYLGHCLATLRQRGAFCLESEYGSVLSSLRRCTSLLQEMDIKTYMSLSSPLRVHFLQIAALYVILLPFLIVPDFGWATPTIVSFIAAALFAVDIIARNLEDPFDVNSVYSVDLDFQTARLAARLGELMNFACNAAESGGGITFYADYAGGNVNNNNSTGGNENRIRWERNFAATLDKWKSDTPGAGYRMPRRGANSTRISSKGVGTTFDVDHSTIFPKDIHANASIPQRSDPLDETMDPYYLFSKDDTIFPTAHEQHDWLSPNMSNNSGTTNTSTHSQNIGRAGTARSKPVNSTFQRRENSQHGNVDNTRLFNPNENDPTLLNNPFSSPISTGYRSTAPNYASPPYIGEQLHAKPIPYEILLEEPSGNDLVNVEHASSVPIVQPVSNAERMMDKDVVSFSNTQSLPSDSSSSSSSDSIDVRSGRVTTAIAASTTLGTTGGGSGGSSIGAGGTVNAAVTRATRSSSATGAYGNEESTTKSLFSTSGKPSLDNSASSASIIGGESNTGTHLRRQVSARTADEFDNRSVARVNGYQEQHGNKIRVIHNSGANVNSFQQIPGNGIDDFSNRKLVAIDSIREEDDSMNSPKMTGKPLRQQLHSRSVERGQFSSGDTNTSRSAVDYAEKEYHFKYGSNKPALSADNLLRLQPPFSGRSVFTSSRLSKGK